MAAARRGALQVHNNNTLQVTGPLSKQQVKGALARLRGTFQVAGQRGTFKVARCRSEGHFPNLLASVLVLNSKPKAIANTAGRQTGAMMQRKETSAADDNQNGAKIHELTTLRLTQKRSERQSWSAGRMWGDLVVAAKHTSNRSSTSKGPRGDPGLSTL